MFGENDNFPLAMCFWRIPIIISMYLFKSMFKLFLDVIGSKRGNTLKYPEIQSKQHTFLIFLHFR